MLTFDVLLQHVQQQPEKAITVFEGREISYLQLAESARQVGGYFHRQGLVQGDVIALLLGNSDEFVRCYFACHAAGITVLPINTRLASREIEYILHHSEAKMLIYDAEFAEMVGQFMPSIPHVQHLIHVGGENHLPGVKIEEVIRQGGGIPALLQQEEDTAVIFYTSGTTGRPKGVMLSHTNCVAAAAMWSEAMELGREDRIQLVAPLFHCAAAHVFMLPTVQAGGTLVIERGFHPKQTIDTLQQQNTTVFFGVPAMYTLLLNLPDVQSRRVKAPNLRLLTYGAAPMPYELIKHVKQFFPQAQVQNLYGQTENTPAATTLKDRYALTKLGSVGEPLPGCQVRVVDVDGHDVPMGQVGEIAIKGPQVMKGYLKNPEATALAVRNGWLLTGDLGRLDEDGLLYIVDRKKDMIIRGGENVYPVEVEEVLFEIPEVLEAAVVGIPHEIYGEVPKAVIAVKPGYSITEEQIRQFCLERLAKYKVPDAFEFVDTLPRNASGKVLKTVLRGEMRFS